MTIIRRIFRRIFKRIFKKKSKGVILFKLTSISTIEEQGVVTRYIFEDENGKKTYSKPKTGDKNE